MSHSILARRVTYYRSMSNAENIEKEAEYYVVELTASEDYMINIATETMFIGWTENERQGAIRKELRTACPVIAEKALIAWKKLDRGGVVVNCGRDVQIFLLFGGSAVVKKGMAEKHFNSIFEKVEFVHIGLGRSVPVEGMDSSILRPAPTPNLRMNVLKRDKFRCRLCGRRVEDNTDIVLNLHHVISKKFAGLTKDDNLVTLCHTCHSGLDTYNDFSIIENFPEIHQEFNKFADKLKDYPNEYAKSVARYREITFEIIRNLNPIGG